MEGNINMGDLLDCCDTGMPSLDIRASPTSFGRGRAEDFKFTGIEREYAITILRGFTADILFTSEQARLRGTEWGDVRDSENTLWQCGGFGKHSLPTSEAFELAFESLFFSLLGLMK